MPEMKGIGVLKVVRKLNQSVPAIILTKNVDDDNALDAVNDGVHTFQVREPAKTVENIERELTDVRIKDLRVKHLTYENGQLYQQYNF